MVDLIVILQQFLLPHTEKTWNANRGHALPNLDSRGRTRCIGAGYHADEPFPLLIAGVSQAQPL